MARRKHDDAHRPLGGRGQRGNRPGRPANWGGAQLLQHQVQACRACGRGQGHFPGCELAGIDGAEGHAR